MNQTTEHFHILDFLDCSCGKNLSLVRIFLMLLNEKCKTYSGCFLATCRREPKWGQDSCFCFLHLVVLHLHSKHAKHDASTADKECTECPQVSRTNPLVSTCLTSRTCFAKFLRHRKLIFNACNVFSPIDSISGSLDSHIFPLFFLFWEPPILGHFVLVHYNSISHILCNIQV